jgi:hypothetical protein
MRYYKFRIKHYQGWCIHLGWLKLEVITFNRKWNLVLTLSNWTE